MFPKKYQCLVDALTSALNLNLCRAQVLAAVVMSAISAKSVLLTSIIARLPGAAKQKSKYRRAQNFFAQTDLDYNAVAIFIIKILGTLLPETWVLSLDRTNWEARKNEVNLLVLSVCLGDVAVPILWVNLGRKGNSDTRQRMEIMRRFAEIFGYEKIDCLLADREFIGKDWFRWLQKKQVSYVIRLKNNFKVLTGTGRESEVKNLFRNLKIGEERCLGEKKICGAFHQLSAVRLPDNEFVILVAYGTETKSAGTWYAIRWNIETGFEKLKSHGFNFEDTRLNGEGKHELLLAGLSIALAWCYGTGEWSAREIAPIKLKQHGRKERSIFGRGLDELMSYFTGCASNLRQLAQVAFGLLRRGT